MSRTFRRTHLNRQKRRVFRLYWMYFSKHEIENISGGTGAAFALIPAQNATGNWIKDS